MSQNEGRKPQKSFERGKSFLIKAERAIYRENYKKALNFLISAKEIFNKSKSILMLAQVDFLEGYIYENLNEYEKTLDSYKKSLENRMKAGTPLIIAETEKKIAETYLKIKNYKKAHEYAQDSIDILENENQPFAKADSLYTKGTIYLAEKDWKSAVFYYRLASDFLKTQYHWRLYLKINENLGIANKKLGNYIESNICLKKALKIEYEKKNYAVIISILKEMAENYKYLNNKTKAINYISDAIQIEKDYQRTKFKTQIVDLLLQYAEILYYFADFVEAEEKCEESLEISEFNNLTTSLVKGLILITKILFAKNPRNEKDFELIKNYINESNELAQSIQNPEYIIEILILKIRLLKKQGKDEKIIDKLKEAEKIAINNNSPCSLGAVYEQFGLYYHPIDLDLSLKYFKKGLEEFIKCDSIQDQAEMHYNIACVSSLLSIPEEIIDHLSIAVKINSKYKDLAREDEDFKTIRNQDLFRSITD